MASGIYGNVTLVSFCWNFLGKLVGNVVHASKFLICECSVSASFSEPVVSDIDGRRSLDGQVVHGDALGDGVVTVQSFWGYPSVALLTWGETIIVHICWPWLS